MLFLTDTEPSSSHRHLASHLIFSLEGETEWNIDGEQINCRGIYIDANAEHIGKGGGKFLSLLFVKTSSYAHTMEKKFLQGKSYFILDEKTVEDVVELVNQQFEDPEILNRRILETCMVTDLEKPMYDERVQKTITMIEMKETIDSNTIAELSRHVCLSQSRLSHLFKAETKMSLAGYLAFEKLRKTYCYLMQGESITASCMKAGFDTPSHCAATCRKMFGLSLSKLKK
ncbi:MAG: helix-turn-helix domain-containing protein [Treponema sp.]|nr:helix-turn-helix domain-containing protein [Candidatus Treponema equifaecale]